MGRRWGKTVLGGALSLATASAGGRVAWVVPYYRNGRPLWRWVEQTVVAANAGRSIRTNRSERIVEFANGGFLGIYSMDNEGSIRGESFHLVILDEAAMIAETAWTDAIQPTMADFGADAVLISTPKGRNWFWQEWTRGQDSQPREVVSFTAPSSANPNPLIQRAAIAARERVPERTYRQEWLAEFIADGGGVFRRVAEAATAEPQERAVAGRHYVWGVDWGKHSDFTAIVVLDQAGVMVALDRFNQIDYTLQLGRLDALRRRFPPALVVAECNSMGEPLVEQLQRAGWPVEPFTTTNASKAAIIDGLSLAFEQAAIRILPDPVLVAELQAYEAERLPSGLLRYGAPEGLHDDTVMALALAWAAIGPPSGGAVVYDERVVVSPI